MTAGDSYRRIYRVVARIPRGRVATYGQVADLAGLPRQARLVGYALNVLPPEIDLPWHRVVNARGQVSLRTSGLDHEDLQTQLLQREGVKFVAGTISLALFRWRPRGAMIAAAVSERRVPSRRPRRVPRADRAREC